MDGPIFDPLIHFENAGPPGADGLWHNFHDAMLRHVSINAGDLRPEDDVWIGGIVRATLDLAPGHGEGRPPRLTLAFDDCSDVPLSAPHYGMMVGEIEFTFRHRECSADGLTPLPPAIDVVFRGFGADPVLRLSCMRVAVVPTRQTEHGFDPLPG